MSTSEGRTVLEVVGAVACALLGALVTLAIKASDARFENQSKRMDKLEAAVDVKQNADDCQRTHNTVDERLKRGEDKFDSLITGQKEVVVNLATLTERVDNLIVAVNKKPGGG